MNKVRLYQLQDEQLAKRYAELCENEAPTDLSEDIALCRRRLSERTITATPVSRLSCRLKTKMIQVVEATNIRRGELLQKQVVLQLALQIARIQTEAVKGRFEGWEMVMDDVRQKVLTVVSEAQNPDPTENS